MKGGIRLSLIGVAGCVALATVWAVLGVPGTALAKKPSRGGGGFIAACVTFSDDQNLPDRIQSDIPVPYCHNKRDKIQAEIDMNGGFRFDTGGRRGSRKVWLDFGNMFIDGGHPELVPQPDYYPVDIRIHDEYELDGPENWVSLGRTLNLVDMGYPGRPDGNEDNTTYVGLTSGPLISFDPNAPGPWDTSLADPVEVIRVDVETWVFMSLPDDLAASHKVVGGDWENPVFLGYFKMPFQMTVRIQP